MRFDNAFAVNGLCSPTRATMHTGLLPSLHGLHDFIDDQSLALLPEDWGAVQEFRTLPGQRGTAEPSIRPCPTPPGHGTAQRSW